MKSQPPHPWKPKGAVPTGRQAAPPRDLWATREEIRFGQFDGQILPFSEPNQQFIQRLREDMRCGKLRSESSARVSEARSSSLRPGLAPGRCVSGRQILRGSSAIGLCEVIFTFRSICDRAPADPARPIRFGPYRCLKRFENSDPTRFSGLRDTDARR